MAHRKTEDKPEMTEVHIDFAFMGEEDKPGETIPILVAKERSTRMCMAAATPRKTTGDYIAKRLMAFLKEVGCAVGDMTIKADQEPALSSIIEDLSKIRATEGGGRLVVENSPVGSSASNGVIERHIQVVEQQVRVMKSALEEKWAVGIPSKHCLLPWIIEYAGLLLNRFEVGKDGKTAYERCKGEKAKTLGIEFGESVLWKRNLLEEHWAS